MEYNIELLKEIREELLEICDTPEESINEIKRYRKEFSRETDFNLY